MVSALEHAGAVELSMRSWRFISGRRRCAVDRLEGPRSRRHEVVVSSCFGTAIGTMKRGSGRPEPRFIVPMAVPKQEDTTTSWRRERGPSRRSTAHRLRPLINRQDRIESSTAPACSSADTMSRSHTAPKIVRLRYERRAPCFVPYYTRRRPRRRESS